MNTSANFLVTAILGMLVFSENVGGLWWLGAAGMGMGCIIVGMRDEGNKGEAKAEDRERDGDGDGDEAAILLGGERESLDGRDGGDERRKERDEDDLVRL